MSTRAEKKQELARVVSKLNRISDQLTELIECEEDDLARIGVGLPVWLDEYPVASTETVEIDDAGTEFTYEEHWKLGYLKLGGRWHIVTKHMEQVHGGDLREIQAPVPLAKAPRHIRAEAMKYLDHLVDCLIRRATEYYGEIETRLAAQQSAVDLRSAESKNGRTQREPGHA